MSYPSTSAPPLQWLSLHDRFAQAGFAFDWHDHGDCPALPWHLEIRPHSLGLCLNLEGAGELGRAHHPAIRLPPLHACFSICGAGGLSMARGAHERHRFMIADFSPAFVREHLRPFADRVHPLLRRVLASDPPAAAVAPPTPLSPHNLGLIASLRHPPVSPGALELWYRTKAVELLAEFLFVAEPQRELFCSRRRQVARERTERVMALLRERMAEPPTLEELGRAVGCSPHHLSRTFSETAGCTIPQYLRQLRMERAAALLRAGRHNVTETALEVGYASLSHFIQAFQETHGCPPGSYPQPTDNK